MILYARYNAKNISFGHICARSIPSETFRRLSDFGDSPAERGIKFGDLALDER